MRKRKRRSKKGARNKRTEKIKRRGKGKVCAKRKINLCTATPAPKFCFVIYRQRGIMLLPLPPQTYLSSLSLSCFLPNSPFVILSCLIISVFSFFENSSMLYSTGTIIPFPIVFLPHVLSHLFIVPGTFISLQPSFHFYLYIDHFYEYCFLLWQIQFTFQCLTYSFHVDLKFSALHLFLLFLLSSSV